MLTFLVTIENFLFGLLFYRVLSSCDTMKAFSLNVSHKSISQLKKKTE